MLYYSLIQSRLQYGITLWGNATKTNLQEIKVKQNTIIRIITHNNRYEALSNLYKSLNFLKLDDIHRFELAKFMFQLHNNCLPNIFTTCLRKLALCIITRRNRLKKQYTFYSVFQKALRKIKSHFVAPNCGKIWILK